MPRLGQITKFNAYRHCGRLVCDWAMPIYIGAAYIGNTYE